MDKKRLVFFTGAGMSKESGLPTFRGQGGVWDEIDAEKVASARSWHCGRRRDCNERRQTMLDFFNPLIRSILEHEPNEGHRIIAEFEKDYDVTVITQNGDDYHTRAGSTNVIYLHGEALKNTSSANPYTPLPIDPNNPDIHIGDKAPDGSQIRPFVIYFDENIDKNLWQRAVRATKSADYFIIVGSSVLVLPAASLLRAIPVGCNIIVINPEMVNLPYTFHRNYYHFEDVATMGLLKLQKYFNLLAVQKWIEKQCTFSALPKDLLQHRGPEEFGAVVKRW